MLMPSQSKPENGYPHCRRLAWGGRVHALQAINNPITDGYVRNAFVIQRLGHAK